MFVRPCEIFCLMKSLILKWSYFFSGEILAEIFDLQSIAIHEVTISKRHIFISILIIQT